VEAAGASVLFAGATRSRRSIQRVLGDRVQPIDLAVYDNRPCADIPRIGAQVLIWTSPMNAEAYLNHFTPRADQRMIAIGPATAQTITDRGFACHRSEGPTELDLWRALGSLA
jgi:uroporphyrinogen-III synthase